MSILNEDLKNQVRGLFASLNSTYDFEVKVSQSHASKEDMLALLGDLKSCSDKFSLRVQELEVDNVLSLKILKDGVESAFSFEAVPTGHEFSTLLIAILNLEGKGKNLPEEDIVNRIKNLNGSTEVISYISLTCTKCPDVVQAMNLISIINPAIKHRIVDGDLFPELMKKLSIQAIPTLYNEDKIFKVGATNLLELLLLLEEKLGTNFLQEEKHLDYDVVVLGGGPAGATSAIYTARKGFKTAIITDRVGGQTLDTQDIENISSHKLITGKEYAAKLYEQLKHYPIDIYDSRQAEHFEILENGKKKIVTSMNEHISSRALIVATGAKRKTLGVTGEADYMAKGIAFCTHCDALLYRDQKVVVVGGGNSGLEAAIDLANIAKEVLVLKYSHKVRGDTVLREKVAEFSNVKFLSGVETVEIKGDGNKLTSLVYRDRETQELFEVEANGVFIQIGLTANTDLFKDTLDITEQGEIKIDEFCRTSVKGIYAAGDCTVVPYKQIVVAQGEGAKAGLSVFEDIIKSQVGA